MGRAAELRAAGRGRDAAAAALVRRYSAVREATFKLCAPLGTEDYVAAAPADECRPAAWHLAHTTHFFETVVLGRHDPEHRPHREGMAGLLESESAQRGVLTRPTVGEVFEYRRRTDERVAALIESASPGLLRELAVAVEASLGLRLLPEEAGRFLSGLRRRIDGADAAAVRVYGSEPDAFLGTAHIAAGELIADRLLSPLEVRATIATETR